MSQAAPAFCIQVPMLDTALAIHSQRNQVNWSGAQVPREADDVACVNSHSKSWKWYIRSMDNYVFSEF